MTTDYPSTLGPGESITVRDVDLKEQAALEIQAARDAGVDPDVLIRSHIAIASWMDRLLKGESS